MIAEPTGENSGSLRHFFWARREHPEVGSLVDSRTGDFLFLFDTCGLYCDSESDPFEAEIQA